MIRPKQPPRLTMAGMPVLISDRKKWFRKDLRVVKEKGKSMSYSLKARQKTFLMLTQHL